MNEDSSREHPVLPPDVTRRTVFLSDKKDYKLLRASRLVVFKGVDAGKELLVEKERITIGRSGVCDLVLTDSAVSGIHCELVTDSNGHLLRDLDSTNGLYMMGHRVREVFLRPGSEFQVGNNLIRFAALNTLVKIPLSSRDRFGQALGRSIRMREVFAILEKVTTSDLPVLLRGETGTGKELLAQALHRYSMRKNRPFIVLDCASIPRDIIESTLFGHEKGAFTGANATRLGVFEEANGGTLFIDEIGELELSLQPKLLRVLEQKQVQRVGGVRPIPVDVRIVAATCRDLRRMVDQGLFREDLFYRLSVVEVEIPPLRDRPEDIPLLVKHILGHLSQVWPDGDRRPFVLTADALKALQGNSWPGNVRQLRNVLERAAQVADDRVIRPEHLELEWMGKDSAAVLADPRLPFKDAKAELLARFERQYVSALLDECGGNLSRASRRAGLARNYLRSLCRKYNI
ncbi:MAG: FHA domain-containing protein, partial [Deltaproteobacteria bacterium]